MKSMGLVRGTLVIHNARLSKNNARFVDFLYQRLGRRGLLKRDCQRMVNQNRNVFAACMVACGEADAMVTGLTRSFGVAHEDIRHAIDPRATRSEEHTSELQSLMRNSYAVFCLQQKTTRNHPDPLLPHQTPEYTK